jgi:glucosylceramidase
MLDEHGGPNHVGNNCDAAVLVNMTSQELYTHPQYWYIGHFSKFVPPGSFRLATTVSLSGEDYTQPTATQAVDDCRGWPYCT